MKIFHIKREEVLIKSQKKRWKNLGIKDKISNKKEYQII